MRPALVTPALVTGLLVVVAVLVAPERQDRAGERPDDLERESRRGGDPAGSEPASAATSPGAPEAPSPGHVQSALVLLALGYRSGQPTWEVLGAVADVLDAGPAGPPAVSRDLRQVAAALRRGASDTEAWASVGELWPGAARAPRRRPVPPACRRARVCCGVCVSR